MKNPMAARSLDMSATDEAGRKRSWPWTWIIFASLVLFAHPMRYAIDGFFIGKEASDRGVTVRLPFDAQGRFIRIKLVPKGEKPVPGVLSSRDDYLQYNYAKARGGFFTAYFYGTGNRFYHLLAWTPD